MEEAKALPEAVAAAMCAELPGMSGPVHVSTSAHLVCGVVFKGDLVMSMDREVGEVQRFLSFIVNGKSSVWACLLKRARIGIDRYSSDNTDPMRLPGIDVLAPLIYGKDSGFIRILLPPISVTW